MSDLEQKQNWKIEAYGKCNRVYTPVCIYWEEEVPFDEAYETFLDLVGPVPPRNLVVHASENPDYTFYEIRLVEVRTGYQGAHIGWNNAVMKSLVKDMLENPIITMRIEMEIDIEPSLAATPDEWDLQELLEFGMLRLVDNSSTNE